MSDSSFRAFLADSFAILTREMAPAYAELCRRMQPHEALLVVGGESVAVRFTPDRAELLPRSNSPSVEVRTERDVILDLVDARSSLHQAIMSERLLLFGSPDDLLRFHDGLNAYLHGAVRAPSFPQLLQGFRHFEGSNHRDRG